MNEKLHYELSPCWDIFEGIYKDIESIIQDRDDLLPATKMTSTELFENAIKYGEFGDGSAVQFDLVKNEVIQISVANRVTRTKHVEVLKDIIYRISNSSSVEELYRSRLQTLLDGVSLWEGSMLGLYRIAYEGEFSLSYIYKDGLLSMTAKRTI